MRRRLKPVYGWLLRVMRFLNVYLRPRFRGMARYAHFRAKGLPIEDKTVIFEAYRASKIADNPYAIFKEMLQDSYYRDFTFIWAIDDRDNHYRKQYASRSNVRFCSIHSRAYARALCTAKYLVNNKTWPFYFSKRPEQVHVTTWHATAFKKLGRDQAGTMGQLRNLTRNLLHADYLVMPNRFTSEVMLRSNDVEGLFPGRVLEVGYPRTDLTLAADRGEMAALLAQHCSIDPAKRIVLYAPTWRGETGGYLDTTEEALEHTRELRALLPDEYELVLKVHDLTYKYLEHRTDVAGVKYVPDWIDTNELLAAVDVLVTDYSSIFFDFLVLDRPVIFFAYDLAEYDADRGLYFDMEDLAGPLCRTAEETAEAIINAQAMRERHADRYAAIREQFCGADDGRASARVCDAVFKGEEPETAFRSFDTSRKRLLVLGCSFDHTRETFEIIGLSHNLNHDVYDVTVLFAAAPNRERERLLRRLHPRTRILHAAGTFAFTPSEFWRFDRHREKPALERCTPEEVSRVRDHYEAERRRLLGDTPFDVAMCFTDRLSDWTYLLSVCAFDERIMWLAESTPGAEERLPAEFVAQRFSRVLIAPDTRRSRFARRLKALDRAARADGGDSIVRNVERFIGFDDSVEAMSAEMLQQVERRIAQIGRACVGAGHDGDNAGEQQKLYALAEAGTARLADSVRAWVAERERALGFDHVAHNQTIADTLYAEVERSAR